MESEEPSRSEEMALQEEPLYDFPEPSQPSESKCAGLQRGRDSLRSVSVLDRLLLTVPVWLQLSINAATALHILQREPPGTFLVRKSRTSKRNVLCLRLADDSVPAFVQQVGIREDHPTFCLETSAISFPDLPRLIAFYCVSRDVLPFPLQLPEAIARATSHKQLESISHMGVEFWNSHLNFRGPREAPKELKDEKKKTEPVSMPPSIPTSLPNAVTQSNTVALPDPASALDPADQLSIPQDDADIQSKVSPTLFQEFCPITTRGPRELNCGPGMAALCFVNPLFLQSHALHRRRFCKRSIKVRISTETSTLLSPPLEPPPPPPLMPKKRGKCKAKPLTQNQPQGSQSQAQSEHQLEDGRLPTHKEPNNHDTPSQVQGSDAEQVQSQLKPTEFQMQEQNQPQDLTQLEERLALAKIVEESQDQLRSMETQAQPERPVPDYSEYQHPPSRVNTHLSPSLSHTACPLLPPKVSSSLSPRDSPSDPPSLSPKPFSLSPFTSPSASPTVEIYQTPIVAGKTYERGQTEEQEGEEEKDHCDVGDIGSEEEEEEMNLLLPSLPPKSFSLSPFTSPSPSPTVEIYDTPIIAGKTCKKEQTEEKEEEEDEGEIGSVEEGEEMNLLLPSLSPRPFSLSPFTSPSASPTVEIYQTPIVAGKMYDDTQTDVQENEGEEEDYGNNGEIGSEEEGEDMNLLLEQQIYASALNETESCSSLSSLEEAAETPPLTPLLEDGDAPSELQENQPGPAEPDD